MVVLISACLKADALATVNLAKASEPFGWQPKDHICLKSYLFKSILLKSQIS